jgi:hypothetical protein
MVFCIGRVEISRISYTNENLLMQILWGASRLPQYIFLIQLLFKIDEHTLWRPLHLQYIFLIQFLFKTDENPLWRPPPPPVHIPDSVLIQN